MGEADDSRRRVHEGEGVLAMRQRHFDILFDITLLFLMVVGWAALAFALWAMWKAVWA